MFRHFYSNYTACSEAELFCHFKHALGSKLSNYEHTLAGIHLLQSKISFHFNVLKRILIIQLMIISKTLVSNKDSSLLLMVS